MEMKVLVGDVGATHARLASAVVRDGVPDLSDIGVYLCDDYSSLEAIFTEFVRSTPSGYDSACFGLAGPVQGGKVQLTNRSWWVDAVTLRGAIGCERVDLINDLEAIACGVPLLEAEHFEELNPGAAPEEGNIAVLSVGSGFGQAGLIWDGERHHPFSGEGGHADFAPRDEIEMEMLQELGARFSHVSWERLLSGDGLLEIYRHLVRRDKKEPPEWLAVQIDSGSGPEAISAAALAGKDVVCSVALDRFVRLLGAEGGNSALRLNSTQGVYLAGGIPPKILPCLRKGGFLEAFQEKGRMGSLLKRMPLRVVLDPWVALRGAALSAVRGLEV